MAYSPHTLSRRWFALGGACSLLSRAADSGAAAGPSPAKPVAKFVVKATDALLVIDVQNCFVPGGSLAVKDGAAIVPVINDLAKSFANVVLTQDWHTADHVSFASQHPGKKPFESIPLAYGNQVLWPDHCVQGTPGAALVSGLSMGFQAVVVEDACRGIDLNGSVAKAWADMKKAGVLRAQASEMATI